MHTFTDLLQVKKNHYVKDDVSDTDQAFITIAYRRKSKNRHKFLCLPEFQSHNTLRLLLLHVNYIQLQRKNNNFHALTIKKNFEIETRSNPSTHIL